MNLPICVDASLIIRTLVPGPFSEEAESLLETWLQADTMLIAPALLAFEVTSTLRRMVYLKALRPEQGEAALTQFLRIPVRLSHRQGIFPLAWQMAGQFNLPRAYDTAYLALAQMHDCPFWTADERLANAVRNQLGWVRWLGEHQINQLH